MFKSIKFRFVVFFAFFIMLSLGIVCFLSISMVKETAKYLAVSESVPIVEKVYEEYGRKRSLL